MSITFRNHGLYGESVSLLHDSDGLVLCVVWHVGCTVEQLMDPVATVGPHYGEAVTLGVLLYHVTHVAVFYAGLYFRDGLKKNEDDKLMT